MLIGLKDKLKLLMREQILLGVQLRNKETLALYLLQLVME